jgi:hypothetical protein
VRPVDKPPGVGELGVPGSGIGPRTAARPAGGARAAVIGSGLVSGARPIRTSPRGPRVSAQHRSAKKFRVVGRAVTPVSIPPLALPCRDSVRPCAAVLCSGFWSVRLAGDDGVSAVELNAVRTDQRLKVKRSILRAVGAKFYFALIWGREGSGWGRLWSPRLLSQGR